MRVNVGEAKTNLSKLLARVEAGEEVEIARDGVPVARLVRAAPSTGPGARFLAARGSLAGQISIGEDFEFSEAELDEMLGDPGVRLLLDTHVVLWELQGDRPLHPVARQAIERASDVAFSVVSFAEIGVKAAIGKLTVPGDLRDHVVSSGLRILGLAPEHGLGVADLPRHHRDPFDRLLIAQARLEDMAIVTADRQFGRYDVAVIDAG